MAEDAAGSAAFLPSRVPEERPGQEGGKRHLNRIAKTRQLCEALRARGIACIPVTLQ